MSKPEDNLSTEKNSSYTQVNILLVLPMKMETELKKCYFCFSEQISETYAQRKIHFDGEIFSFYFCKKCFSYSLYPKLSDLQLHKLYSLDYVTNLSMDETGESITETKKFERLQEFLISLPKVPNGNFLDYGCGADPMTFAISQKQGLEPSGMEFSEDVRKAVMAKSDKRVYSPDQLINSEELFDVIFVGDVIEHLINPERELRLLKSKLKEGGILIAQGPLQAAWTLTHLVVVLFALMTKSRSSIFEPYHVSLATRQSMLRLMESSGFGSIKITCTEVSWPAPSFKSLISNPTPRNVILFICKTIDKIISKFNQKYGSRYFLTCEAKDKDE